MHPLFADPAVQQAGQPVGGQPVSSLAAALMQPRAMPQQQNPVGQLPLASLMSLMKSNSGQGAGTSARSGDPNLVWNPNNPIGTDTLGGNTANQGSWAGNAAAAYLPGYQGGDTPAATRDPVVTTGGAYQPTVTTGGAYQPTQADQGLMNAMQGVGALAPQYQQPAAPVQPQTQDWGWLGRLFGGSPSPS